MDAQIASLAGRPGGPHLWHQWSCSHSACQDRCSSGSARRGYSASAATMSGAGSSEVSLTGSRPTSPSRRRCLILPCRHARQAEVTPDDPPTALLASHRPFMRTGCAPGMGPAVIGDQDNNCRAASGTTLHRCWHVLADGAGAGQHTCHLSRKHSTSMIAVCHEQRQPVSCAGRWNPPNGSPGAGGTRRPPVASRP